MLVSSLAHLSCPRRKRAYILGMGKRKQTCLLPTMRTLQSWHSRQHARAHASRDKCRHLKLRVPVTTKDVVHVQCFTTFRLWSLHACWRQSPVNQAEPMRVGMQANRRMRDSSQLSSFARSSSSMHPAIPPANALGLRPQTQSIVNPSTSAHSRSVKSITQQHPSRPYRIEGTVHAAMPA